jgi:hypothetical protein
MCGVRGLLNFAFVDADGEIESLFDPDPGGVAIIALDAEVVPVVSGEGAGI